MDVGATNGWRLDDVVPAAEVVRTIGAEFPLEPVEAALPRRGRRALPLPRRRRRDRRHRVRHAAVLRRLHARADLGRREALHLPLRRARPRPPRRPALGERPTRSSRRRSAPSGRAAPTATRSSAPRRRARSARSRCPTSAGDVRGYWDPARWRREGHRRSRLPRLTPSSAQAVEERALRSEVVVDRPALVLALQGVVTLAERRRRRRSIPMPHRGGSRRGTRSP